ncbi:dipeptidase PepV [Peptococcus simiae]|uniref:dipeptidase PepV n=1 Tax=Peptococcus simiae TaxID=1643805 RepID=UPI003980A257
MNDPLGQVMAHLNKNHFHRDLAGLLAIESVRDDSRQGPGQPFGPGPAQALAYMLQLADRDGFEATNIDGYAGRIAWGAGEDILGILVHVDVVPATGDWASPPFEASIRNGFLYARGAADDKGPAMAAYYALLGLKEAGFKPKKRIHLIIGTDEESDWGCMARYFATEPMPSLGFSPDADFPLINGEKGMVTLNLTAKRTATGPLKILQAGERANMVPDRAEAILIGDQTAHLADRFPAWCQDQGLQGQADWVTGDVKLTLQGKSAHGAEPAAGRNAASYLAAFLQAYLGQGLDPTISFISDCLHRQPDGAGLGLAFSDEVMGPLTVNAGIVDIQPATSRVNINIRYPRGLTAEEIVDRVRAKAAAYGLDLAYDGPAKAVHYIPADDPLVATLLAVYQELTGDATAQPLSIGGGTYARMMPKAVAYGPLFPGEDGQLHQANEHIALASLYKAIAIYQEAIRRLTEKAD